MGSSTDRQVAESERREQQTIAALKARIRQAHQLAKQGAAVMADKEALKEDDLGQVEASAPSRQQERAIAQRVDKLQARELRLLERRCVGTRDAGADENAEWHHAGR